MRPRLRWLCLLGWVGCSPAPEAPARNDAAPPAGEAGAPAAHEEGVVELSPEAAARTALAVAPVEMRVLPTTLRTTARVAYDEEHLAHVNPPVAGRVREVPARLGQQVEAGAALAVIESIEVGELKAEYLRARAEEALARQTLEREERLLAEQITSEQSVIEARTAHQKAVTTRRALAERLRLLGLTDAQIARLRHGDPSATLVPVRAPLAGRVVEKHVTLGERVTPERTLFTVADPSRLWIWIDVYERDLAKVHEGDAVRVVTEAWPGRAFHGEVAYISAEVDPATRAARARIDLPNPDGALKPGMFAEVTLTDAHAAGGEGARPPVPAVPASALLRDDNGWIAFVQTGERRYERREVRVGERTPEHVEVVEGLRPGERVVVEGGFVLKSAAARERMGEGHAH